MSRLDPQVHEANRKANQSADFAQSLRAEVDAWLKANPQIGELNGSKYYINRNNQMLDVYPLEKI